MARNTKLRREIRKRFVPFIAAKGFSSDMRHASQILAFRKITRDGGVYVCDIQWDKRGRPRFVINFGKCAARGVIVFGKRHLPENVFSYCTPIRGRLHPGSGRSTRDWFRQDRPLISRIVSGSTLYPSEEVVSYLISMFPEVEEFWANGRICRHIHMMPNPAVQDLSPTDVARRL